MKDRHGSAVPERHGGADGDKGVHVARAVLERRPSPGVEPFSGPELHGHREDEQQDVESERENVAHRRNCHERHDERGDRDAEHRLGAKVGDLTRISRNLFVCADAQHGVSGVLYGGSEVFDVGETRRVLNGGALGREVYG